MKILLLLILALQGASSWAAPSLEEVAQSPGWKRLLYYKYHWFGGRKSAVDGEGFFLSATGKSDPLAELRATVAALEQGGGTYGKLQQPIHCAFPARTEFLSRILERRFPGGPCPELEDYLKKVDPVGASLVFATAYTSNPASMFGHSFLKITSRRNQEGGGKLSLLDWSVNYAAMVPEDENPFAFVYFGLAGGYAGQFALVPYYAKIEEYGYSEGRDMWEYDLNLTHDQLVTLVKAIWEIETNSHLYYFFFDENCSYELLTLLETVRPDWKLSSYFIHMIPGESVQRVYDMPSSVKDIRMRASLERRLRVVGDALNEAELAAFGRAKEGGEIPAGGRPLQAYILYLQAEKKRLDDKWTPAQQSRMTAALAVRARSSGEGEITAFGGERTRPDLAHGPDRVGLGGYVSSVGKGTDWGTEFTLRFAYHDLLEPDPGFTPHSEIQFPHFRFRYSARDKHFTLQEAELLALTSLNPWNSVRRPLSWQVRLGYGHRLSCDNCHGLHGDGGVGLSFWLNPERWSVWAMIGAHGFLREASSVVAPKLSVGSLSTLPSEAKVLVEAEFLREIGRDPRWNVHLGFHQPLGKKWGVRWEAQGTGVFRRGSSSSSTESSLHAVHYF